MNNSLWADLSELTIGLQEHGVTEPASYCLVAVSCFVNESILKSQPSETYFGPYLEAVSPESLNADWHLIGYDVADGSQISGLSNCGYTRSEEDLLRATWKNDLNQFHLFDELNRAADFVEVSNARVREHAPFLTYSLHVKSGNPNFPFEI